MRYINQHSCLIPTLEQIGICDICVAFERHICCWYIYAYNIINKVEVHCFFIFMCSNVGS